MYRACERYGATKDVEGQYKVWTCFPFQDNHQIEIYRIEILPGNCYEAGSHGTHTREYIENILQCWKEIWK